MNTTAQQTAKDKLIKFARQRSGIDRRDYYSDLRDKEGIKAFCSEYREITNDLKRFNELMIACHYCIDDLDKKIETYLKNSSGRLTINENGHIEYCTGQYFPTEYRKAAGRVLADLLWADFRDSKDHEGNPTYNTGHEIRTAIRKRFGRALCNYWFN